MSAALAVQLTVEELSALVETAVRKVVAGKPAETDFMTRDLVADMLDVHPKVITTYVKKKGLPAKRIDRKWIFSRREVLAWMEEQAVEPGAHTSEWGKKIRKAKGEAK